MVTSIARAIFPRRSVIALLLVIYAAAGCSEDSPMTPMNTNREASLESSEQSQDIQETRTTPRASLSMEVSGAFRPGVPVSVKVQVRGERVSSHTDIEILSIDEKDVSSRAALTRNTSAPSLLTQSRRSLGVEGTTTEQTTITFDRPGYYRIVAKATSPAPEDRTTPEYIDGSLSVDLDQEIMYVYISEDGGRLTDEFDHSILAYPDRRPLFGSFGPFIRDEDFLTGGLEMVEEPEEVPFSGLFKYFNIDTNSNTLIPNASLEDVTCHVGSDQDDPTFQYGPDASGAWEVFCPDGTTRITGEMALVHTNVHLDNISGRTPFDFDVNLGAADIVAKNPYSAHVYKVLHDHIPTAFQEFGRTRGQIVVLMWSDASVIGSAKYTPSTDRIETHPGVVFGSFGNFVTLHEYGHAFHVKAIDLPRNRFCSPSQHTFGGENTIHCAFNEGFANFFAAWIGNALLTTGSGSDYRAEVNFWQLQNTDGLRVEGKVTAFLYDLVDGTQELDGLDNMPMQDNFTESIQFPASFLADLMDHCTVSYTLTNGNVVTVSDLDGIDELVYRLEKDTDGWQAASQAGSSLWRTPTSVTVPITMPTGWSKSAVRDLWLLNLYNVSN